MLIPKQLSILFRIIFLPKESKWFAFLKHLHLETWKRKIWKIWLPSFDQNLGTSQQFGERPDLDSTYLTTYLISTFHSRGSHLTIIVKLEFIWCWLWVFIHFFTRRRLPIADNHSETENLLHHQELVMSQYSTLNPSDPSSELQFHNFRNLGSRHIWINGYVTVKLSLLLHLSTKYQAHV